MNVAVGNKTIHIDWTAIISSLGVIAFVYGFLHNFKADVNSKFDKLDSKINSIEERMFWMATGKKLEEAILEQKLKQLTPKSKNPCPTDP